MHLFIFIALILLLYGKQTHTHTHIERNYRFVIHNWTYFSDLHHKSRDLFLGRNVMCHIRLFIGLILFSLMVLNQYRYFAYAIEMLEMQSFIRKDGYWVWFNDIHRGQFSVRRHFFPITPKTTTQSLALVCSLYSNKQTKNLTETSWILWKITLTFEFCEAWFEGSRNYP